MGYGHNILIAGDLRSGKSWITCEQLILEGYCLCVIDPEWDYATVECSLASRCWRRGATTAFERRGAGLALSGG